MKETTQAKITASVTIAKAMAQKALAPNPNPQWTEYEMRSIDEWIARQDVTGSSRSHPPPGRARAEGEKVISKMSELKNTETAVSKFDDKLHKLIKRAKKQRGMLWPSVVSKLELARADVKAMIKVYDSGPK